MSLQENKTSNVDLLMSWMCDDNNNHIPVKISTDDYQKSVDKLAELAFTDCGGARAAAQVLLSLYNGKNWHVDLIDLCNLDPSHYRAAIIAIRCRVELNTEPHVVILDGDDVFERLQSRWQLYHVKHRYLV